MIDRRTRRAYQLNQKLYENIKDTCLNSFDSEATPLPLLEEVWENLDFPMHCSEYHFLIPAALLTVYRRLKNDDKVLLEKDLAIAKERAKNLLAGFCGWYGACGAAMGAASFLCLLTDTSPYFNQNVGASQQANVRMPAGYCVDRRATLL